MTLHSAVTTCPRPGGVEYLADSLASIRAAGFDPFICADPVKVGSYNAFLVALGLLHKRSGPGDRLLIFQDDIRVASGLSGWISRQSFPDGIWSLYCASTQHVRDGWFSMDELPYYEPFGALAIMMTREHAGEFLDNPPGRGQLNGTDGKVATFCRDRRLPMWLHSPSFVEHVGEVSVLGDPRGLIPQRVAGEKFCRDVADLQRPSAA